MKITHFRVLSSLISEARLPLSIIFLILILANIIPLKGQSQLATSPLYEKAAQPLRSAPIKEYEFDKASVRDVLRFLADDAGIDFVAMPEEGNDGAKLITIPPKEEPLFGSRNNREVAIQSVVNQPVVPAQSSTTPGVGGTTTSSVSYLPIGTSINVLPKRLEDGRISLQVLITVSSIIGSEIIDGNSYPVASSRVFTAPLEVESGYTLAIGGLDEASDSREGAGLPILSKIPILRHGFKSDNKTHSRKNMLIFITPTLLDPKSGGISETPISEMPMRGNKVVQKIPSVKANGSLVGGINSISGAMKWIEKEHSIIKQIVREKRGCKKHSDRLDALNNSVIILQKQIAEHLVSNPNNKKEMEQKNLALARLSESILNTRKSLKKKNFQLFSRPLSKAF